MACSPPIDREAGYATAAAALTALALALVSTAVLEASVTTLRRARIDFDRAKTEAALDGVQASAIGAILEDGATRRLRWTVASPVGEVEVLAEPEAAKVSLTKALSTSPELLADAFVVVDEGPLLARLRGLAVGGGGALELSRADSARLWRACGSSVVSPYGQATSLALRQATAPKVGRFGWHAGEIWRIRTVTISGQADERIVRMTGDPLSPAAVVERRFLRGEGRGERCQALIDAL